MSQKFLKTSTSLALVLSMTVPVSLPAPVLAQEVNAPCGPDVVAPCLREDGTILTLDEAEANAAEEAAKAEAADAEAIAAAETEAAAEAEAAAAAQAAIEEAARVEAEAAQAAEAKTAAEAEQAAAEKAEAEAKTAAEAELAAAAKAAEAAEQAEDDAKQVAAEANEANEATEATEAPEAVEAVDTEPSTAQQQDAPADPTATDSSQQPLTAADVIKIEEPKTVISEDTGLSAESAAAEAEIATSLEEEGSSAAAAAAEGAAPADDEKPQVTTTTVTAQDVRASDQEFVSAKDKKSKRDKKKADKSDDSKGLTDLQKILLAAGGIAVVGAILKNGSTVVQNTGDRVVAQRDDGSLYVLRDDDALVRRPGSTVETKTYNDGSTITVITKADGTKVRTIQDAQGRVLQRTHITADGREYLLFDDTVDVANVDVSKLPRTRADRLDYADQDAALEAALNRELGYDVGRNFSLNQIRNIRAVRELVPQIDLDAITFDSGSAAIRASEAKKLARLGRAMQRVIDERPYEVFLIEGHTDSVGSAVFNLTLSDRRAESLALALTEYFDVPPENMVVQGYGEGYLKVAVDGDIRANRRVAVRRVTPLLGMQTASR